MVIHTRRNCPSPDKSNNLTEIVLNKPTTFNTSVTQTSKMMYSMQVWQPKLAWDLSTQVRGKTKSSCTHLWRRYDQQHTTNLIQGHRGNISLTTSLSSSVQQRKPIPRLVFGMSEAGHVGPQVQPCNAWLST